MSQIRVKKFNKHVDKKRNRPREDPYDIETFQHSFRLIFFVSKFFGYSLFRLPKVNLKNYKIAREFEVKSTLIDFGILIAVLSLNLFIVYYNTVIDFQGNLSESVILSVGGKLCLIFGLVVSSASIILCYVKRDTMFKMFITLCYIDIQLEILNNTVVAAPLNTRRVLNKLDRNDIAPPIPRILDHKKHYKFSVWFVVIGVLSISLDLLTTYAIVDIDSSLNFVSNPLQCLSYFVQNASFFMITAQTVIFLLVVKSRHFALNKLICCYLIIQDDSNHSQVEELYDLESVSDNQFYTHSDLTYLRNGLRFDKKIIGEFAQIHDKLNDVVEWINSCYSVQCLGVVAVSFGYVIITFFSLYYAVYRPHEKTVQLAAVYAVWFIFYVVCVMSLIVASWIATNEGDQTGVLLHKSINQIMVDPNIPDKQSNEIIDTLRTFSLQLQKRSPVVSCGLFTYDWTLLYGIIASSATYLIILIQFDSSMRTESSNTNSTNNCTT